MLSRTRSRTVVVAGVVAAGLVIVALLAWNSTRTSDSGRVQYWDPDMQAPEETTVGAALSRASERVDFEVRIPGTVPSGFLLNAVTANFAGEDLADRGVDHRVATLHFTDDRGHGLQVDQLLPGGLQPSTGATPLDPSAPGVEAYLEPPGFGGAVGIVTVTWVSQDAAYLARYIAPGGQPPDDAVDMLLAMLGSMR